MVRPLFDRIIVEVINDEEQVQGGIYIPKTVQEYPKKGKVLAVGPGRYEATATLVQRPMSVKEGDVVYFSKFAGAPIQMDNKDCLVILEGDLLAVEDVD